LAAIASRDTSPEDLSGTRVIGFSSMGGSGSTSGATSVTPANGRLSLSTGAARRITDPADADAAADDDDDDVSLAVADALTIGVVRASGSGGGGGFCMSAGSMPAFRSSSTTMSVLRVKLAGADTCDHVRLRHRAIMSQRLSH
jgi:hypothetical protein